MRHRRSIAVPVRLIIGLLKGLLLGGLIGYGLAAAGFGVPGALVAYLGAAVTGMLVALVAGKPIWADGARIEVGMKALAGALLAPGLMWLARHFLTMDLPLDLGIVPGLEALAGKSVALGTFAITSLGLVAAVLAGFYDADNQPVKADKQASKHSAGSGARIEASATASRDAQAELEAQEAEAAQQRRKS